MIKSYFQIKFFAYFDGSQSFQHYINRAVLSLKGLKETLYKKRNVNLEIHQNQSTDSIYIIIIFNPHPLA